MPQDLQNVFDVLQRTWKSETVLSVGSLYMGSGYGKVKGIQPLKNCDALRDLAPFTI